MNFGDKLKHIRQERNMTQEELAKLLGTTKQTISHYENSDREPNLKTAINYAKRLNVDIKFLADNFAAFDFAPPSFNAVPLVGQIACGSPVLAEENIKEYVDLPKHIKADYALSCKGNSMIGAGIYDGDVVYIRQQPVVEDGQIAAVLIDDEATLKRVYHKNGTLILQPENPTHAPLIFTGEELRTVRVIGIAVAFTHSLI